MAEFLNPELPLEDLGDFFADAAADGGIEHLDPVLCSAFAMGLREASANVRALITRAAEAGLLERLTGALPPEPDRTPAERRAVARRATRLDPDGRVLSFPTPPVRRISDTKGGSAA